jgi:Flp pilus assembly protein TadG
VILRMLQSLWRDKEGTALVEGAVLMPMMIVLVGGVFEFSWVFYQQKLIEAGVRDAARYLTRVPTDFPFNNRNPCLATNGSGGPLYTTYAQNVAVYGSTSTTGFNPRVNGWTTGDVTITCPTFDNSAGGYVGGATLYRVLVSTSFPDPSLGFFGLLGLSPPNISAGHEERYIGPG